ncbi:adenylate kinase-domain-containing protein [Protomyces lactucae-debilis]|uniref:Uridylate kinase n=1 Tax=Protomyces lactucae-debilis TaxID=2754530 RepID=A0A1Y2FEX4_PROLT|nr:adenylate kinase-domain-containing protein [Protomyces lactucae-debilis]ORY82498.1 adenylate kinase-domain-containing protein [Protomyces lactucae-debilis]
MTTLLNRSLAASASVSSCIRGSRHTIGLAFNRPLTTSSSNSGSSSNNKPKPPNFLAFFAIGAAGFATFAYVSKQLEQQQQRIKGNQFSKAGVTPTPEGLKEQKQRMAPALAKGGKTPTFSQDDTVVVFVLGGPGVGKGTQCGLLVKERGFVHLSAGDLLRAEQKREGSEYGAMIKQYITDGQIVPMEVTVALLENAMHDAIAQEGKRKFLIDGFPRKMDQAVKFEETVCPSRFTIFFDCSEETMMKRLLKRGETSGRDDDNIESIRKRFRTFVETSMPVVEYFEKQGKVCRIQCEDTVEQVSKQVQAAVDSRAK